MLLPYMKEGVLEAGCDEAGRGCLAGAVFAAAVILPPDFRNEILNDSKQLSEKQRYALRPIIETASAHRRQSVQTLSRYPAYLCHQRRREIRSHCRSFYFGKDLSRRLHEPPARGVPLVRLDFE